MIRLSLFLLASLAVGPVPAQTATELVEAGRLGVRAYAEPGAEVYVGQQVRFFVEVTTDSWFTDAPRYPELRVAGAVALEPERFSSNVTRRVGGRTLSGQRKGYLVYPQRAGTLEIPPVSVRLGIGLDGKPSDIVTLSTDPVLLNVQMPPGVETLNNLVTTPELSLEERYEPPGDSFAVGDALTRTVTMQAQNSQALLLPPVQFTAPGGVAVYPGEPELSDGAYRGRYRGTRTDTAIYVFEKPGEYRLPAVEIQVWDPVKKKLDLNTLPERSLRVTAAPVVGEVETETSVRNWGTQLRSMLDWLTANMVALSLALLAALFLPTLLRRLLASLRPGKVAERRRIPTEKDCFARLLRACRDRDEEALQLSLWPWLDAVGAAPDVLSRAIRDGQLDDEFARGWQALNQGRYGPAPAVDVDWSALARGFSSLRSSLSATSTRSGEFRSLTLNPR